MKDDRQQRWSAADTFSRTPPKVYEMNPNPKRNQANARRRKVAARNAKIARELGLKA